MSSSSPPSRPQPSFGTDTDENVSSKNNSMTLVEAMQAADIIRKSLVDGGDPKETERVVPPGTWQGAAAFAATGLLMTPFRRSILKMSGTQGPFQGFIDLVITPIFAVCAAQTGLVIGTLYGSSYYLDRLAMDAVTTTKTSPNLQSNELMSVRLGQDNEVSYSPTSKSLATKRENMVTELCRELLSLSPLPQLAASTQNLLTQSTTSSVTESSLFDSWDPRSKTMKSLLHAVDNCRRRDY